MKIDKYEIDMLAVGQADALIIHFWDADDKDKEHIILVDAGHKGAASKIKELLSTYYTKKDIDLAICTHCDADHFGGFIELVDDMINNPTGAYNIKKFWINRAQGLDFSEKGDNLLKKIDTLQKKKQANSNIEVSSVFTGATEFGGIVQVLGPSKDYFDSLFSLNEGEQKEFSLEDAKDDDSEVNKSSIIFLFQPGNGRKFLFTGDATKESFEKLKETEVYDQIKGCHWLKVPHHGSENNISDELINDIKPKRAWITNDEDGLCFSKETIALLQQVGADVCIADANTWHHHETKDRESYNRSDVYYPQVNTSKSTGKTYTLPRVTK